MLHLLTLLSINTTEAHVIGFHDWPQQREELEDIAYWAYEDGWYISPVRETQYTGTRVGLFIEKSSELDIDIDVYQYTPDLLVCEDGVADVELCVHSHALRSLCPVTGQPDWASIAIDYQGAAIQPASLLRYLVSYRNHQAFHETTIERIYTDIWQRCGAKRLSVYGRFLRRGGIDINPYRSSHGDAAPRIRVARQ